MSRDSRPAFPLPSSGHRQLAINLLANVGNFSLNILVGLWMTPYLIHHLGTAAFGLIPLAASVTAYLSLFTMAMNGSTGRYLTLALEKGDKAQANHVFNSALVGSLIVVFLLFAPSAWTAWHADLFFNVPNGHEVSFELLLAGAMGAFLVTNIAYPFGLAAFCRNRLDFTNAINILGTLAKTGVIVVMFTFLTPSVWHVGLAVLGSAVIAAAGLVWTQKRLLPFLSVRFADFSWPRFREMSGTGVWMVINQIGSLLYLSIDLIVVNVTLGATATGRYGAVIMWSTLLRSLASTISGIFAPTILILFARGDIAGMVRYARQSVKFLGLAMTIPIGLICGYASPLLSLWLGPEFEPLAPLMTVATIHLCVNLSVLPLFNIQIAANQVRVPGVVTCAMGFINLGLALLLVQLPNLGMYGVAVAGLITLTAKNVFFTPVYAARILGTHWSTFIRELAPIALATVLCALTGWWASSHFRLDSWTALVLSGGITTVVCGTVFAALFLSREDRNAISRLLASLRGKE